MILANTGNIVPDLGSESKKPVYPHKPVFTIMIFILAWCCGRYGIRV